MRKMQRRASKVGRGNVRDVQMQVCRPVRDRGPRCLTRRCAPSRDSTSPLRPDPGGPLFQVVAWWENLCGPRSIVLFGYKIVRGLTENWQLNS